MKKEEERGGERGNDVGGVRGKFRRDEELEGREEQRMKKGERSSIEVYFTPLLDTWSY